MNKKNALEEILLENNFIFIKSHNEDEDIRLIEKKIDSSFLQFHFAIEGKLDFLFNNGNYSFNISEKRYLTLYNPNKNLPVNMNVNYNSRVISILISIKKFHKLFSEDGASVDFLNSEKGSQKYYKENEISNSMLLILDQMFNYSSKSIRKDLYIKAKIYELFSLIFHPKEEISNEQCPFIMNDDHLKKIKLAKKIIIEQFFDPPTLIELSNTVNLSLRKLKEGFKKTYGKPVFQYLIDYKMELATKLLTNGENNVNEVSLKLGYSTASHFISAFKRRFGVTPRSYIVNN